MKGRIFRGIFFTSLLVLALTVIAILIAVSGQFSEERIAEVKTETAYIKAAYAVNADNVPLFERIGGTSENRVTLIAADGTVLYDNYANAAELDNHLNRPEIAAASAEGIGESKRASTTLGTETYYYALKMEDGGIVRVAATMKSVSRVINNTATVITLIIIFAVAAAIFTAQLITKSIVAPINSFDLERPLINKTYDELSPLLSRMDKQNRKINEQMNELSEKQREFTEITDKMSEALVIFGADRRVMSANISAELIFHTMKPQGLYYLELCRDKPFIEVAESAFSGKTSDTKLIKNGRVYRLSASPVKKKQGADSGSDCAAVMFAVDITGTEHAEQMRREFSANVSHELKTPLTSILGYAEIMNNGVAKQEDFSRFSGMIYNEAKRLLTLIEDIIKLSKLDEGGLQKEFRTVELYSLSEGVFAALKAKADAADVTLSLEGEAVSVNGIENTLREMVFNLCDNAVNYNKRGGSVTVRVGMDGDRAILTVADNGIGIAPEYQSRIFERFYRVDKSHSKETGGTGLGLSIVKHGAALHGADIRLTSTLGKGTEISLIFA